jgi:DNA-binding CsgD family transcriptional regulator
VLEHIGLTPDDERAYRAVLERPGPVGDLAPRAGLDEDRLAAALRRLAELELAHLDGTAWVARPPDAALAVLHARREADVEREQRAVREGRALVAQFLLTAPRPANGAGPHLAEIVEGNDAVGARVFQVVESATSVVRILDRPPYVYNAPEAGDTLDQELRLLRAGIEFRVVYDATTFTPPELSQCLADSLGAGEQARVLPDVPVKLVAADANVAILPLVPAPGEPGRAVVLHTPVVVEPLTALFESLWQRAIPVGGADPGDAVARHEAPSAEDRVLLRLLAAGLKDGAIARNLGTSERTTNRRISELIDRLDAQTRFQAGLQAARRGWI